LWTSDAVTTVFGALGDPDDLDLLVPLSLPRSTRPVVTGADFDREHVSIA